LSLVSTEPDDGDARGEVGWCPDDDG